MNFDELFHMDIDSAKSLFGEVTFLRLQKALDDFNAALSGKPPLHAQVDTDVPLPTDGGTTFYKGNSHNLTIVKSLDGIMRGKDHIHSYINGQVISFEADVTDFIPNKTQTKFGR